MKWILVLLLVGYLAIAQPGAAQTNGNELSDQCRAAMDGQSGARAGLCLGFIEAYRELAIMLPLEPGQKFLCLPEGVSNGQFLKVLVKYLDQHPEKLHLPAAQLVYDATNAAFPCSAATK